MPATTATPAAAPSAPSADALGHLAAALAVPIAVIDAVADDQWTDATPCPGWDVAAVVTHLRDGTWWFSGTLGGPPPTGTADARPATVLREASDALLAGFSRPGALDAVIPIPLGEVPGIVALHLRATEALVHGWDVAVATGQDLVVDDAVAGEALGFSVAALEMLPPERSPFAPPRPVTDDAPPLTRLVALLGRDPSGPA
ncbi:TIGR03086 family protein [Iamia sp. SCSIO 61187]|uniref:TIGR03086 family metal-binding protein n=1 Tax=Iamia sp. SCSIO 61187 TaxID=2722752 RepID=UPI001C6397FD|nr:TIGR03086 family metal-binding protein [Iamia sp. SCSIO 61187]QYG95174.1 TIGR03086 family protein [Iamia sp. SCSIO 61187]